MISDGGDGKNEIALGLLYFVSWIRRCAALTKLVVIVRDPEHRLLGRFVAHPLGQDAGFFGSMAPMVWVIEMRSIGHGTQTPLHSTGSYATVKVGPPPAQPERPLPAIASPSASRALKGNCFLKLPCPNPTAGLQSTQKNKTEESNGCSDIHHEIGSGRVI